MNLFYYKKVTALALILAILLPMLATAQRQPPSYQDATAQYRLQLFKDLQQKWKEEDGNIDDCKPGQPQNNLAGSLQQVIARGIQQNLSQSINRAISQNLQNMVQRQLGQVLPQVIQNGLSQQLPGLLRQKMRASNVNQPNQNMVRQAITELLPRIIQSDLPGALESGLAGSMRSNLSNELQTKIFDRTTDPNNITSPILSADTAFQANLLYLFDPANSQFAQTLKDIPGLFLRVIEENAENQTKPTLEQAQAIGGAITKQLLNAGANDIQSFMTNIMNQVQLGIANDAAGGVAKSTGVDQLVQRMMPVIMQVVLNGVPGQSTGIMGAMNTQNFNTAINQANFDNFNFNDWAGNNITAAVGFDLAPVSQAIAQPLALATVSGLGISGYDTAIANLGTIGFNGPVDISTLQIASQLTPGGANYLAALPSAGPLSASLVTAANSGDINSFFAPQGLSVPTASDLATGADMAAWSAANPDFVGPPSPAQYIGADAASAVNPSGIGSGIGAGLGQLGSQLGAQMQGAFVNGISGTVGGLVDGIPYVGGLLSPIAEQMVQTVLTSILPSIASANPTWQVNDFGTQDTVQAAGKGIIKATSKPLGKIQGFTQQTVKELTEVEKKQLEQIDQAVKNCLKNKATKEATRALELKNLVDDPAAWSSSMQYLAAKAQQLRKYAEESIVDPRDPQNATLPVNANIKQNQDIATEMALRQATAKLKDSDDPDIRAAAETIARIQNNNGFAYPTLPKALRDKYVYNRSSLTPAEKQQIEAHGYWGKNDSISLAYLNLEKAVSNAERGKANATAKFLASDGTNEVPAPCQVEGTDILGLPVCLDEYLGIQTSGADLRARLNAVNTSDISKAVQASGAKQDNVDPLSYVIEQLFANSQTPADYVQPANNPDPCPGLGQPCSPSYSYAQSGYAIAKQSSYYGLGNGTPISFNDAFNQSLNQVINNGLNNTFGQLDGQLSSLSGYVQNGFANYGGQFTAGSCDYSCQSDIRPIVVSAIGDAGITPGQYPNVNLVDLLVQWIVELIRNSSANATP